MVNILIYIKAIKLGNYLSMIPFQLPANPGQHTARIGVWIQVLLLHHWAPERVEERLAYRV